MNRKTVIYKIIDESKHEFVVRNRNTDDFPADFRHVYDGLVEDKYLDHEIEAILSDLFNDDYFNLIALFDAPNEFNRDQKVINERKQRLTDKYICDGWVENIDLDKHVNDISYDRNKYQKILNIRDLITLLNEKREFYKNELSKLEGKHQANLQKCDVLAKEHIDKKREQLKSDLNALQNRYEQEKEKLKTEIYSLIQEKTRLENKNKELTELKDKHDDLLNEINEFEKTKTLLINEINENEALCVSFQQTKTQLESQIQPLKENVMRLNEDIERLQKHYNSIMCAIDEVDEEKRFYIKDKTDLQMFRTFMREHNYDSLMQLHEDIKKYNEMKK